MNAPSPTRVILALSLVLSLVPPARAEMVVVSDTRPAGVGVPFFFPVITPFTIPGYDPSLPPLESVSLRLSTAPMTVGGFTYANPFSTAFFDTAELTETFSILFPGRPISFVNTSPTATTFINAPPFTSPPVVFNLPAESSRIETLTDPSDLQFFTQQGNVTLNVRGDWFTRTFVDPFRLSGSPQPSTNSVTLTVTYTSSAIPEPATLSLVGLGVVGGAGCGWWRRKRMA